MRFSVFLTVRSMDPNQDGAIIQAMTDFALQAEELGFDAVFCPDHHFTDMQDEPVEFDTGHYRGAVVQRIVPRSFRRPYPLMMGVALREASIERAVKYGWSAFIPDFVPPFPQDNSPSPKFLESLTACRDALNGSDYSQALKEELLDWTTHPYQCVHVAETDAQARRELEFIVDQYQQAIDRERPYNKRAEQISGVDLPSAPDARDENWIKAWCLFGSPETVTAELRHYADTGVGNVLLSFTNGPFSQERWRLSQQSIRLFADEVMPHFTSKAAVGAAAL